MSDAIATFADRIGKHVAGRTYFHTSVLNMLDASTSQLVTSAAEFVGVKIGMDFNVVRFDPRDHSVSLLSYPDFFDEACPLLARSWKISLKDQRVTGRTYHESFNPPVLHRKELLLDSGDSRRPQFEKVTAELEALGCFEDPVRIGFKVQWERLLADHGFRLVGHQLTPIGNEESPLDQSVERTGNFEIARHLTALSRQNFSAPMQILQRLGFLDGSRTVFDYGCGKGDDLRGLLASGLKAAGWDPYYAPDLEVVSAEIVNLGFVINVIEDPVERREALQRAFSLAAEVLVVSTMLATDNPGKALHYGDGVLTSRATFQKYYTQSELREYLASTLKEEPIPVAPGIFFVFKDKDAEQRFQVRRYRARVRIRRLVRAPRPHVPTKREPRPRKIDQYEVHRALLEPLWLRILELGREPDPTEVPDLAAVEEALGSLKKALRLVHAQNDSTQLAEARKQRTDDIKVFLALQLFQKRKPYKSLEPGLQRDIRVFFGDYASAQEHAKHLLFKVAQPEILDSSCEEASERGLGWLEPGHSLQLHSSLVSRLPAPLRVYVGCAAVLYGDVLEADLVKIHIRSGKVSFMKYDDFLGHPIPSLRERAKINLRNLTLQLFNYGTDEYPSPPLYIKSRFINEESPSYAEQLAFDEKLQALDVDFSGYGPTESEFSATLGRARLSVNGFQLERLHRVPALDEPCGQFLTYRQLIECGETQARTGISNLPTNPESYTALYDLATTILDPVIEYFGSIRLTYGFCSAELASKIPARVAPKLDQHAAYECKRTGAPICSRLGAAVDFIVQDENMREVADWIMSNVPFDRLYYYGLDRPLHVSFSQSPERIAFEMIHGPGNRRIPRPLSS